MDGECNRQPSRLLFSEREGAIRITIASRCKNDIYDSKRLML